MKTAAIAALTLLALASVAACAGEAAVPPADGVWRFDFGSAQSPAADGFLQVLPDTAYSPDGRFGYAQGRARPTAFDQNRRIIRDHLSLDGVTRDGIYGGNPFRVDLPNGTYRVVVLTGQYSRPGANRPDSHFRAYTITANGVTLYEQDDTPETFYDPTGRYFHNYYRDWQPDVNLYQANISGWIPFAQGDVTVTDGALELQASRYAAVNAVWVFEAGSEAGEATLREFSASQESWFNRQYPYLPDEPEHPMPEVSAEARGAGVVLWPRDEAIDLRPGTRPAGRDLGRPLRLFASRGEWEPAVVAVTPLKDLAGPFELTVSEARAESGSAIPGAAFDVRYVRYGEYPVTGGYVVKPHFLVPWRPDRMDEGITRGFWIDLRVPEEAEPGFYSGTVTFSAPGVAASLPLQVRVLPLKLPVSRLYAGVYAGDLTGTTFRHYRTMRDLPKPLVSKAIRKRIAFFAQLGFTGLFDGLPWYPFELKDGQAVPAEMWDWYLETFRAAAEVPNFRERIFCYYLGGPQMFPKCPHYLSIGKADKMEVDDIRFPEEAVPEMTAMLRALYERVRAEKLPELTFYVFDELGNHGARGARWGREMLKTLNRCREDVPGGFRTCVSALRASVAREYLAGADIVMPNSAYPITPETIAEIRKHGCTLGLYNLGATRFSYGFYPWRVRAYTRAQWSFSYDGDSRDPFVSLPAGSRVSCDCHFTPDWEVLPSIGMLQQREGVDDYRYIQLLEERIEGAEKAGGGETAETRSGKAVLSELREMVKETYLSTDNNWDRSTMDYYRWRVAEAAMAIDPAGR